MIDNWRINANQIPLPPAMPPGPAIIQHHLPQHPQNEYIDERQLEERIGQLRKQISDSEYNLKAQESALNAAKQVLSFVFLRCIYTVLSSKVQTCRHNNNNVQDNISQAKIEAQWKLKEERRVADIIKQIGLNITGFEKLVDHMQTSGSKETISV